MQAEVGWLSDRTFLEEYYENEWDNNKDQLTGVRLKRTYDNQSFSIEANARINDFFTQTQWLPRLDHYWLGQPLIGDNLTWFEHSSAAYANIGVASTPTNPQLASAVRPASRGKQDRAGNPISGNGERLITRQEIDWPIDAAPFKIVPYGLGELGDWGEDINGDRFQRAYGPGRRPSQHSVLVRRPDDPRRALQPQRPRAQSRLRRPSVRHRRQPGPRPLPALRRARRRLDRRLPPPPVLLAVRRQACAGTYYIPGAPSFIDPKFDPRFYALRYGLQDWVTSPSTKSPTTWPPSASACTIACKPSAAHPAKNASSIGSRSTPTPRGSPTPTATTPAPPSACWTTTSRWHLGDRFSILSDGYADTFGDGLKTASIGLLLNRPARGNFYLGFRAADGIFVADVLNATVNYRMTDKWIGSASSSVDFGPTGNIGQTLGFTRIGESLLATIGASVDASKGSVGVHFLVEPRFLPKLRTTSKTGIEIAPAGAYGLE